MSTRGVEIRGETTRAIVADYKAGLPTRDIARRNNVHVTTVNKVRQRFGLSRPRSTHSSRPTVACQWCGVKCRSAFRECQTCAELHDGADANDGLSGKAGRWVFDPFRRIQVWAPWMDESGAA